MLKMIIVDDEATIRDGLQALVESFCLDIHVCALASTAQDALNKIRTEKPELLLLDISLPDANGLELLRMVQGDIPGAKIIIISGYDQFEYAHRALQLGVYDYLLKPIKHAVLYNTLISAVEAYHKRSLELDILQSTPTFIAEGEPSEEVIGLIRKRLSDPNLSLTAIAETLHVSLPYLSRSIKQKTGQSFTDYLTKLRMEQAKQMLSAKGPVMIYDIAERVGYSSQHYFSRVFKEYTGMTPRDYLKAQRG